MTLSKRFHEIRTGFERPFWVANISELFERLSYYAAFASLARYLHETLNFGVERKMIPRNPIKGYKIPKSSSRITYLTPEQELEKKRAEEAEVIGRLSLRGPRLSWSRFHRCRCAILVHVRQTTKGDRLPHMTT